MRRVFLSLLIVFVVVSPLYAGGVEFLVKRVSQCPVKVFGGGFNVREVIHPKNDGVNPGFSVAYITLGAHRSTAPHKLTRSAQVYFILDGVALLHVGGKTIRVEPGMAIYIAPNVVQWAENRSDSEFTFLCIVSPPWSKAEEVVLGGSHSQ